LDQPNTPQRERLHLRSLADGTLPTASCAGVRCSGHARTHKSHRDDHLGDQEPGQPPLGREFCPALRTVTPDAPTQLRYRSTHHGVVRVATIFDLGPEHDRLYVHCSTNDFGDGPPSTSA